VLLLLGGCANNTLIDRLEAIDAQPYLADAIAIAPYTETRLAPLVSMPDLTPSSVSLRHEQHKLDRLTVTALDKALSDKARQLRLLRDAMKNIEVADRATLRAAERLRDALAEERKWAEINDIKHTALEVLLGILLLIK